MLYYNIIKLSVGKGEVHNIGTQLKSLFTHFLGVIVHFGIFPAVTEIGFNSV